MPESADIHVASHAPGSRQPREVFLDVFRGYALIAITLNHFAIVARDEGLANARSFTLTPLGLSSAAEIFVLCSGCAFALAYRRLIERSGLREAWPKALRRAMQLMLCNLLMTLMSAAVITLLIPAAYRAAGSFAMARFVFDDPLFMLKSMALLQWRPAYHDVLPLYAVLLVAAPLQLFGLQRRPLLTIGLSACIWLLAVTGAVAPGDIGLPGWYFHPLAWQFLFLLGMVMARSRAIARVPAGPGAFAIYALLLAGCFALKLAAHHGVLPASLAIGVVADNPVPLDDKLTLGPLRIAHALLLAAALAALYRRLHPGLRGLLDGSLGRIGRFTLPAFVASNPLMFLAGGLLATAPSDRLFYLLCLPLAASLLVFVLLWQRSGRLALPQLQLGSGV